MTATDPAARLRQAATLIRKHAAAADRDVKTEDFWACYDPATAWRDGLVNGFGGVTGDYAALMSPGVGEALAAWLDLEADVIAARQAQPEGAEHAVDIGGDHALTVADAILGPVTP